MGCDDDIGCSQRHCASFAGMGVTNVRKMPEAPLNLGRAPTSQNRRSVSVPTNIYRS